MLFAITLPDPTAFNSDVTLARQAQDDPQAFARLYQQYLPGVYRYHLVRTGDSADAQDLTSDTFMVALKNLDKYAGRGSLAAWLFGIARNQAAMHFRSKRPEVSLDWAIEMPDTAPAPEQAVHQQLEMEAISLALESLSAERAEVIRLCAFAGLPAAEVGRLLGKSEAAIKMLLMRGLRELRAHPILTLQEEK